MPAFDPDLFTTPTSHLGGRQHRFMEAADINAAFREVFIPLRANLRRGLAVTAELYALEVDPCIPGELLAATWLPLASHGVADAHELHDTTRRHAMFQRLLAEQRPEALFTCVRERVSPSGRALLCVEIASADGFHAAEYRIVAGSGWHARELIKASHRRMGTPARVAVR